MDFHAIAEALSTIQATGSSLAKQQLLRRYGDELEGFKDVLKFIYDPYFVTGLKQAKLDSAEIADVEISAEDMIEYLKTHNTGTRTDAMMANSFIYASSDLNYQWAATGLVTKDLQIGVSVTTLNTVYGKDFIPRIGIMRGMICPVDWHGLAIVTEKIDGNRRLFFNTLDGVKTYTRSGKPDKGLTEIESEISQYLPKGYMYDCECVATGNYADSIELRQASASVLNRRNQQRTGVQALCFDMVPISEYNEGKSRLSALGRKTILAGATGQLDSFGKLLSTAAELDRDNARRGKQTNAAESVRAMFYKFFDRDKPTMQHFASLPVLGCVRNYNEGTELAKRIWDVKGEGVMLVEWSSPYVVSPNPKNTLLKIKLLKEYVVKCLGMYEGDNKYAGKMGGISVEWEGATFNVGTGFSDLDRHELWHHPELIIGKMVEIESFGESTNKQGGKALNCPVFKRICGKVD